MRLLSDAASSVAVGPVTPASHLFAPFSPDYLLNPYPVLGELRGTEPVFFSPELGSWVVTRYESIRNILRNARSYSARIASDPLKPLCPMARAIVENSEFDVPPLLVNNDPPDHTRCRRFFGQALQRPRLQALEPFIRETVSQYLDRMEALARPADLVTALTWDVPALVLFRLLGVPQEDVAKVKAWADSRVVLTWGRPSDEEQVRLSQGAVDYYRYASELVRSKVQQPADDYLSDLVRSRGGDDTIATQHEITVGAFNLLFAGHETTSSASANMFKAVLARRELWSAICNRSVDLSEVVEESLRFDPPVQAWRRLALENVCIDGADIPAGSRLLICLASGNHDAAQFPEPDAFLPERADKLQHLTFGVGTHFCMGAPLARLEVRTMLELVSQRFPAMALVPDQGFEYTPNTSFRALKHLLVTW